MKFISKTGKDADGIAAIQREFDIQKDLQHHNIVELLDDFETAEDFCHVTDLALGKSHA